MGDKYRICFKEFYCFQAKAEPLRGVGFGIETSLVVWGYVHFQARNDPTTGFFFFFFLKIR